MPSFVNLGAYVDEGTMIDTWASVGSCAQVGKNCHISGGAGIGGVLEPLQAGPVIIEDNCFIGARSEIAEGVLVEDPIFGGFQYDYGGEYGRRAWNATNGIADAIYDLSRFNSNTLLGNFNVGVKFTDWMSLDVRYSGQYQNSDSANRSNEYYGGNAGSGYLGKSISTNLNQNFLQMLRFNKVVDNHSFDGFLAHESTENKFTNINAVIKILIFFILTFYKPDY